jgi:hypothetical protein
MGDRDVDDERLCYNSMGFINRLSVLNDVDISQRDRQIGHAEDCTQPQLLLMRSIEKQSHLREYFVVER